MSLNKRQKKILPLAGLYFAVCMMAFSSYGSFNPTRIGFYLSLFAGLIWAVIVGYLIGKFQTKKD
ncbi:hypothetical protein ACFPMF_09560 [Larkinella bovis]|uniref:Uncharacterized protein n=1 Tax=Larkinella bovis TaxID=683041 RepID=A0ABW0IA40_9BACT